MIVRLMPPGFWASAPVATKPAAAQIAHVVNVLRVSMLCILPFAFRGALPILSRPCEPGKLEP
jgi:hypothetical protein